VLVCSGDGRGRFGFAKPVVELPSHRHGGSDSAVSVPEQKLDPCQSPQPGVPENDENQLEGPTAGIGEEKEIEQQELVRRMFGAGKCGAGFLKISVCCSMKSSIAWMTLNL
jgi:hypothetical protein